MATKKTNNQALKKEKPSKEELCAAVKDLRAKTGMTQKEFVEYFELEPRSFQDWEQGRRKPPAYVVSMMERIWALENKACSTLIETLKNMPISEDDRELARQFFSSPGVNDTENTDG